MPLIDTRVPLIAVSCLAQSWAELSTPATAETHRTIAITLVQIDGYSCRAAGRRPLPIMRPIRLSPRRPGGALQRRLVAPFDGRVLSRFDNAPTERGSPIRVAVARAAART